MKNFIYYTEGKLPFPLDESISVVDCADESAIVSNCALIKSEVVAREIDLYIKNTQDEISQIISGVKKLYDARLSAFDRATFTEHTKEVGTKVVIIGEHKGLREKLKSHGFGALVVQSEQLVSIAGEIGGFEVCFKKENEIISLQADMIVLADESSEVKAKSGVVKASNLSAPAIAEILLKNSGSYEYKTHISYDYSICQYHKRREEICGKCADICPHEAIVKTPQRELEFSPIDCSGCGLCLSVCPSGSLDSAELGRAAFLEVAKIYKNKTPLLTDERGIELLAGFKIEFPKNTLPFIVPDCNMLNEAYLLTLLQESGSRVVLFAPDLHDSVKSAIYTLNEIYRLVFQTKAIFLCDTKESLRAALQEAVKIENSAFSLNEEGMKKREIFSNRLSYIVNDRDFGVVKAQSAPDKIVRFGYVRIDESKCTLCLSCVGACNVGALKSFEEDFTLRLNDSICTTCKYCEYSCPEHCIEVVRGELPLKPEWFATKVAAKDEPAFCAECGKAYATSRSIDKVAALMKPIFGSDEIKLKTLYCCGDCKAKLMVKSYVDDLIDKR